MSNQTTPIVSATVPTSAIVDVKSGMPLLPMTKWMQNIATLINKVFSNTGAISPDSIPFPTSTSLGGVVTAGPAANQWINAIDGTGTPQLSQPAFVNLSGSASPAQVPALSALSGSVSPSQVPPLSDLNGVVTPGQVPPLQSLNGAVTVAQLPAGLAVTITTAKLTTLGANGSMTFNAAGQLIAQVQAT
jgi:hypothetical protein